jgi:3-hydroxyisobutyrate dehydrogenase
MAERLAKAGCDITVWNRTRAKAEPLAKSGAKVAGALGELAACDIVFTMVGAGKDVKEVLFGPNGVLPARETARSWSTAPQSRWRSRPRSAKSSRRRA